MSWDNFSELFILYISAILEKISGITLKVLLSIFTSLEIPNIGVRTKPEYSNSKLLNLEKSSKWTFITLLFLIHIRSVVVDPKSMIIQYEIK